MISQINNFLEETNLYKTGTKYFSSIFPKWNNLTKTNFIIKQYGLEKFNVEVTGQIERYNSYKRLFRSALEDNSIKLFATPLIPVKLWPTTLLALTWGKSMITGGKKDWINMENLIKWFSLQLEKFGIYNVYNIKNGEIPSSESLRKYWNDYKGTEADYLRAFNNTHFRL